MNLLTHISKTHSANTTIGGLLPIGISITTEKIKQDMIAAKRLLTDYRFKLGIDDPLRDSFNSNASLNIPDTIVFIDNVDIEKIDDIIKPSNRPIIYITTNRHRSKVDTSSACKIKRHGTNLMVYTYNLNQNTYHVIEGLNLSYVDIVKTLLDDDKELHLNELFVDNGVYYVNDNKPENHRLAFLLEGKLNMDCLQTTNSQSNYVVVPSIDIDTLLTAIPVKQNVLVLTKELNYNVDDNISIDLLDVNKYANGTIRLPSHIKLIYTDFVYDIKDKIITELKLVRIEVDGVIRFNVLSPTNNRTSFKSFIDFIDEKLSAFL